MASITPFPSVDPSQFEGLTHAERRSDGMLLLQKTIDFSHPSAPVAFDVLSRGRMRSAVNFIPFIVTLQEAAILHRGP